MDETEPKYIMSLRNDLKDFKDHVDNRFNSLEVHIEKEIEGLAVMTANSFKKVYEEFGNVREEISEIKLDLAGVKLSITQINLNVAEINNNMVTKQEILPILQDHKFRITKLEKEAFA